jgi:hypothetical protein
MKVGIAVTSLLVFAATNLHAADAVEYAGRAIVVELYECSLFYQSMGESIKAEGHVREGEGMIAMSRQLTKTGGDVSIQFSLSVKETVEMMNTAKKNMFANFLDVTQTQRDANQTLYDKKCLVLYKNPQERLSQLIAEAPRGR